MTVWGGIVPGALLFGLLHVAVTATLVPLTPALIVLLNGSGGGTWGGLFRRHSLEAAMGA